MLRLSRWSRRSTYISQSRIRILAAVVKEGDHAQETVGETHNIALLKDARPIEERVSWIVAHATGLALSRHARIGGSRRASTVSALATTPPRGAARCPRPVAVS